MPCSEVLARGRHRKTMPLGVVPGGPANSLDARDHAPAFRLVAVAQVPLDRLVSNALIALLVEPAITSLQLAITHFADGLVLTACASDHRFTALCILLRHVAPPALARGMQVTIRRRVVGLLAVKADEDLQVVERLAGMEDTTGK